MKALRLLSVALLLAGLPAPARSDDLQNDANNPLTPKMALQVQDYYQPVLLSQPRNGANQVIVRSVLPHEAFGVDQLARASLPVVSSALGSAGSGDGPG